MGRTTARRRTGWRTPVRGGAGSRRTASSALLTVAVLVAAGCAKGTEPGDQETFTASSSTSPGASTSPGTAADAADGAWTLRSGDVDGTSLTLQDSAPVTLLVEDGRASGSAACNTYTAQVDSSAGWRVGQVGVTRMACEAELMTLESAYLDALARVDTAELTDGTLVLTGPGVRLVYAHDPEADAG